MTTVSGDDEAENPEEPCAEHGIRECFYCHHGQADVRPINGRTGAVADGRRGAVVVTGDELLAQADELQRHADELFESMRNGIHERSAWQAWDSLQSAARHLRDAAVFTLRVEAGS